MRFRALTCRDAQVATVDTKLRDLTRQLAKDIENGRRNDYRTRPTLFPNVPEADAQLRSAFPDAGDVA